MGNSGVELNQTNFNFSLHGSDFNSGEFLKPAPRNETCETESSSSTTDVNLMKSAVFNEIDFPKDDIFSENNLESFGNFITPLRNNPTVEVVQSSPVKASSVQNTNEYSDASSESDFEESQKDVGQKTKQLPELSPMLSTNEISNVQLPKRNRKMPNMNSKYDLINSDVTSPQTKKSLKKKKKIKKKKNDEESGNITEIEERGIDDELKRKKRKSGQIESEEKCENHSKKKTLSASKEDKNSSESQSNVELQDVKVETETESSEIISREETNTEAAKKSSLNINSQSVAIQESKDVTEKEELNNEVENKKEETAENSALEGFLIVDEVINNESEVIFSDSDSALSPLQQPSDIQLNCEDGKTNMSETEINQDNFSVKDLQMAMSNDPDLWEILECDKTPSGRSKGRRCNRCRQFGHMAIRCPNKVEPKCALCGESGHYEPRCPNKICTQCGQRSPYSTTYCSSCFKFRNYQCPICSMMGHLPKTCPDLWRRYHLTTEEGPLVIYNGPTLKNKNQLWCSGCAQPGHLEHSCRFYRSVYPPQDPHIKSYEDVYHKKTSPNLNSRQQQFKPFIQATPNYGTVLNSQIIQTVDQPDLQIFNYNQNNYGNINPPFVNPYLEGIFVANQQNFFPSLATNVLQYPQNNFLNNHNQYEIPNFVSFDDTPRNNYEVQKTAPSVKETNAAPGKIMRRKSKVFFSGSANQLQHFIFEELHRLSKLSLVSNKLLKELRKGQAPRRRDLCQREEYYETLNMLLFGVFNLIDGKTHLERLKQFKRDRVRMRVDNATRRILHNSYCYIFGRDKHHGVNYNELLRTV